MKRVPYGAVASEGLGPSDHSPSVRIEEELIGDFERVCLEQL